MPEPLGDAAIAAELVQIQQRLAAMVGEAQSGAEVGAELGQIRAQLPRLAADNEEVRRYLESILGDAPRVD